MSKIIQTHFCVEKYSVKRKKKKEKKKPYPEVEVRHVAAFLVFRCAQVRFECLNNRDGVCIDDRL